MASIPALTNYACSKANHAHATPRVAIVTGIPTRACSRQPIATPWRPACIDHDDVGDAADDEQITGEGGRRAPAPSPAGWMLGERQQEHHRRHVGNQVAQDHDQREEPARIARVDAVRSERGDRVSPSPPVPSSAWLTTNSPAKRTRSCQSTRPSIWRECILRLHQEDAGAGEGDQSARPIGEQEGGEQGRR